MIVFSRNPSASCVETATGRSDNVVFSGILFGTCCSVTLVCASLTSRGSFFVVILLLLSDPDGLGCSALFSSALSSLVINVIAAACSSHVLRRSCLHFYRHVARARVLVSAFGGAGLCLMLRIFCRRLQGTVSSLALCPAQFSSEAPTRDG